MQKIKSSNKSKDNTTDRQSAYTLEVKNINSKKYK